MEGFLKYFTCFLFLLATKTFGQISPGELSQAHAHLEGMSNCTSCHDIGKKVTDKKCLDCHKEIKKRIDGKKGLHANSSVVKKNCIECHSDHHGRKFDMVRFNKEKFNHTLTGYALEGKHKVIECKQCHTPENIHDAGIKKKQNTFLGLETECLSCHDDYHRKTLSNECTSCHNMEAFKPAAKFDHNKTGFRLSGKHQEVDCKECHKISTRNGEKFQEFSNIAYSDCNSCHSDPHNGQIRGRCTQCHTETSFTVFSGKGRFNHNVTNFTLKGRHKEVDCFTCHRQTNDPKLVFRDKLAVDEKNCNQCHKDVHENKFGSDCAKCHNENSFFSLKSMDNFDHDKTDFALEGKHLGVDCKKCHKGRYSDPIDFSACRNCHKDYHQGEFRKDGISPDCNACHSLENGFDYSLYTIEKHQTTIFPLEGAHLATPCFACHLEQDRWTFRDLGSECYNCHENIHNDQFAINGVTDCARCHVSENWYPKKFDHDVTDFPLEGRHAEIDCKECHKEGKQSDISIITFKIEKFKCIDCHQ